MMTLCNIGGGENRWKAETGNGLHKMLSYCSSIGKLLWNIFLHS